AAGREAARQAAEREAAGRREAEQREAAARQASAQQQSRPAAQQAAARPLRPISMPAPRYPAEALRAGTSGDVLVEFTVGTSGEVTDVRVLRAHPTRNLHIQAVTTVRHRDD